MLATIVFGEKMQIWQKLNMQPPAAYTWSQENKIVSCLSAFFISNTIENALIQTGAFEVELNNIPIWSKLKTGRVPQGEELFEIISNQLSLLSSKEKKSSQFVTPQGDSYKTPESSASQQAFDDAELKETVNSDDYEGNTNRKGSIKDDFEELHIEQDERSEL